MLASSATIKASSTTVLASAAGATFIGATNASTTGGTSIALAVPSGVTSTHVDDLLFAVISHRGGSAGTITAPAGWTPTAAQTNSTTVLAQRLFYKVAVLGDLGSTVTFNFGASLKGAGVLVAIRGINPTTPFAAGAAVANASAPNITIPALTMADRNVMLLACAGKAHDEAHSQISGWSLNASATAASGGGGATSRNRVSVQFKTFSGPNPTSATVVATTAAVSVGHQVALLVGTSGIAPLTASPGDYTLTGILAGLVKKELFGVNNVAYGVTGVDAQLALGNVPPLTASPGAYDVTGTLANFVAGGLVFTVVGSVDSGVSSYSDTTVVAATTYQYRIVAVNSGGETLSNEDIVTTPAASNFPITASSGSYNVGGVTATFFVPLQFTASPGVVAVTGVAATLLNPFLTWEVIDTLGPGASSFSDIGLDPNTTYIYRVVAINASGQTISNYDTATTLQGSVDYPLSAAVGAYTTTGKDSTARVDVRALPSAYAVVGVLANAVLSRNMPALTGSYVIIEEDASVVLVGNILAAKGTHVMTGAVASTLRTFIGQTAVPTGDITDGNWTPSTGVDLYPTMDETTDDDPLVDTDYANTVFPASDTMVLDLTDLQTPNLPGTVQVLVRARRGTF